MQTPLAVPTGRVCQYPIHPDGRHGICGEELSSQGPCKWCPIHRELMRLIQTRESQQRHRERRNGEQHFLLLNQWYLFTHRLRKGMRVFGPPYYQFPLLSYLPPAYRIEPEVHSASVDLHVYTPSDKHAFTLTYFGPNSQGYKRRHLFYGILSGEEKEISSRIIKMELGPHYPEVSQLWREGGMVEREVGMLLVELSIHSIIHYGKVHSFGYDAPPSIQTIWCVPKYDQKNKGAEELPYWMPCLPCLKGHWVLERSYSQWDFMSDHIHDPFEFLVQVDLKKKRVWSSYFSPPSVDLSWIQASGGENIPDGLDVAEAFRWAERLRSAYYERGS